MSYNQAKKLISEARNICLIPNENDLESISTSLAIFYTLKELGKNVNLILENFPEKLNFLVPSIDQLSVPKNFVISIPRSIADVSQIYYEKTDENLKIHLALDKGNIKKENISFYFKEAKPDMVFTLGIQDFKKQLEAKLDSFGFLLGSEILNIDNNPNNLNFGQINLVEQKSLSEIVLELIKSVDLPLQVGEKLIDKNVANCLLAGLTIYYENFKSKDVNEDAFKTAADLVKRGANNRQISDNLFKTTDREMEILAKMLRNLRKEDNLFVMTSESEDFNNVLEPETGFIVEKIKTLGVQSELLALWASRNSDPVVRGFFYSNSSELLNRVANSQGASAKRDWVFLQISGEDVNSAKDKIISLLLNKTDQT